MRARANLTGGQARAVQAFLATVNLPSGGSGGESPLDAPGPDVATELQKDGLSNYMHRLTPRSEPLGGPLFYDQSSPSSPASYGPASQEEQETPVGKGRALAAAKGCIGCHVMEEKGGAIGPSLDDLFERREEDFVREKLTNPRTDNPNSVMPDYGLSAEEVGAFVAYLKTLGNRH